MGCNCKEETYSDVKKYSDSNEKVLKPKTFFGKVFSFILRLLYGILLSAIVIGIIPFVMVYVVFMAIFGNGVTINIKKLLNVNGKK